MRFFCRFTWFPGTSREQVAVRLLAQHDARLNNQGRIRG